MVIHIEDVEKYYWDSDDIHERQKDDELHFAGNDEKQSFPKLSMVL